MSENTVSEEREVGLSDGVGATFGWLGLLFGSLSVVILISHGFKYGIAVPLKIFLQEYEHLTQVILGWTVPWIMAIGRLIGLTLTLEPYWKHVFVMLLGVVVAILRATWHHYGWAKRAILAGIGTAVSLIAAVAFGVLTSLRDGLHVPLIILSPFLVVGILDLLLTVILLRANTSVRVAMGLFAVRMLLFGLIAFCVTIGLVNLNWLLIENGNWLTVRKPLDGIGGIGDAFSLGAVIAYGLVWIVLSAWPGLQSIGLGPVRRFALGRAILATFLGAMLFLATSAGLELVGFARAPF